MGGDTSLFLAKQHEDIVCDAISPAKMKGTLRLTIEFWGAQFVENVYNGPPRKMNLEDSGRCLATWKPVFWIPA